MTDGGSSLPELDVVVDAAEAGVHPWILRRTTTGERRAALAEELSFWLDTACRDLDFATGFRDAAPDVGQPAEAYLHRWLPLRTGGHVLAGIRYLGLDPELQFVGIAGSDRVLVPRDQPALRELARARFAAFRPGFVLLETADQADAWPGSRQEKRRVVGQLGELRARPVPAGIEARQRPDVDHYERYVDLWRAHHEEDPRRRRWGRAESLEDLAALADQGLLFDVEVDGGWAGVLAAEPAARWGARGATVVELLLDPAVRGRGLGRHLSTLLARELPMPDEQLLFGEIHHANQAAYRAALAAGRVDVGGEVVIPI